MMGSILVAGCIESSNAAPESKLILLYSNTDININRFHDDEKNVTCYITMANNVKWQSSGGGISCLPDSQIK